MVLSLQECTAHILELIFKEDATAYDLLTIAAAFAVIWAIVFAIARPAIGALSYNKPWLKSACERDWDRGAKAELEMFFGHTNLSKDAGVEILMRQWPWMVSVSIQHVAGVMLCVPSLMGWRDPSWASSLAVLGVISEIGWEIEDSIEKAYTRLFTEGGDKKVPNGLIFMLTLHHTMACGLGIPMVLCYRNLKAVHWVCFNLQVSDILLGNGVYEFIMHASSYTISYSSPVWWYFNCKWNI